MSALIVKDMHCFAVTSCNEDYLRFSLKIYRIIYSTEFVSALIVEKLSLFLIHSNIEKYDGFIFEHFLQIYVDKSLKKYL